MTTKQKQQYNKMVVALNAISKGYQTPKQLRKNANPHFGLDYEEALEMAYENIQLTAKMAVKNIKPLP